MPEYHLTGKLIVTWQIQTTYNLDEIVNARDKEHAEERAIDQAEISFDEGLIDLVEWNDSFWEEPPEVQCIGEGIPDPGLWSVARTRDISQAIKLIQEWNSGLPIRGTT